MKTCPQCMNQNDDDAIYCKNCGKALDSQKSIESSLTKLNNMSTGDEIFTSLQLLVSMKLSENRRQDLELLEKISQMSSQFKNLLLKASKDECELWEIMNKVEESVLSLESAHSAMLILYASILQASYQNLNYFSYKYAADKMLSNFGNKLQELNGNATKMTLSAIEMLRFKYLSIIDK